MLRTISSTYPFSFCSVLSSVPRSPSITTKLTLFSSTLGGVASAQSASLAQENTVATEGLIVGNDASRFETILRVDNGTYGNPIEGAHYYYNYWPIGLAVSSTSRIFVCYTRGNYNYTVSEVSSETSETPFPAGLNLNTYSLNTTFHGIDFGSSRSTGLISVQALFITPATSNGDRPETLWLLDTGRPTTQSSDGSYGMPYAQPGGPKVIGVSLANKSLCATYLHLPRNSPLPRFGHERPPLRPPT